MVIPADAGGCGGGRVTWDRWSKVLVKRGNAGSATGAILFRQGLDQNTVTYQNTVSIAIEAWRVPYANASLGYALSSIHDARMGWAYGTCRVICPERSPNLTPGGGLGPCHC